jgi:sugar phosphate isomerase/epimerase
MYPFNICTSVFAQFSLEDVIDITNRAGLKGIELKVHDDGHQSIDELEQKGVSLRKQLNQVGLDVPVLNSYVAAEDFESVDRLINCAQQLDARKIRLVLPKTLGNSAYEKAGLNVVIPSYGLDLPPVKVLSHLKNIFEQLEQKASQAGITFLFELHWGTIMSSFSAAYLLLKDFDPTWMAVTFDPANMMIEGREDWEYGISLLLPYIQNVHVKNTIWSINDHGVSWNWSPIQNGDLNWFEVIGVLAKYGYKGDFAIEDFRLSTYSKDQALLVLQEALNNFMKDCNYFGLYSQKSIAFVPELSASAKLLASCQI